VTDVKYHVCYASLVLVRNYCPAKAIVLLGLRFARGEVSWWLNIVVLFNSCLHQRQRTMDSEADCLIQRTGNILSQSRTYRQYLFVLINVKVLKQTHTCIIFY